MAGETSQRTGISSKVIPYEGGPCINGAPWVASIGATQLQLNDVLEMGYLPANSTLIGFFVYATDMDTNGAPALVSKITVGSTDVPTGLTTGQAAGGAFVPISPITLTAKTLVKLTFTTAAATAAAGTYSMTPLYVGQ
jgi:hypothetical protein